MEDRRREEVVWEGKLEQGRRLAKTGPGFTDVKCKQDFFVTTKTKTNTFRRTGLTNRVVQRSQ